VSLRNTLKFVYFKALDIFNIDKHYLAKIKKNNNLVILNLHRISNDKNPFYPSLTPELFEKLLNYVTGNFNVITFNDIEVNKNSIKPNLILSFDDGFYDFLDNAMPILKKYNIKANLNVIPSCIETGLPVWDVLLGDILNNIAIDTINSIDVPDFYITLNETNRSQYGLALTRHLKQLTKEKREALWMRFYNLISKFKVKHTKMLNKQDIIYIAKFHEIGAHSFSHESMAIESNEFFKNDFLKCRKYFTNILKIPMNIYAFPSGSYKNNQIDFLHNNGINHVLLVDEQYASSNSQGYHRFTYYANSASEVKMRAVGFQR